MALQKRIELLDGWRGMAVSLVLFGHFVPLPGSEIARLGVELFFLLSGRLMAQILVFNEARLPTFYWRRFTRVIPGLYVFVAVVFLLSQAGLFDVTGLQYTSVLTMWSNYLFTFAERQPVFGHTWSLAIEEHSYIVLGILAFVLRRSIPASLLVSGLIILFGFLHGAWLTWGKGLGFYEVYWRTDVRAASLFCGYFGYIYHRRYGLPFVNQIAKMSDAMLVVFAAIITVQFASVVADPIKYTLGTIMTGLLLLALEQRAHEAQPGWVVRQIFEQPKLILLGQISYSVYLYQQIFHVLKEDLPIYYSPLFIIPALLLGYLSYHLVEQPSRKALNGLGSSFMSRKAAERT
ncbi:acyltransferase [Pseudooceanicola sp. CBS1P-1]|uniref:Acyltransferase family protein n=1 Tax=Pseudooceanicola albus TaxID=2692189 RepID=A0A6L7GA04_9RHOB|nr:MULTISPECIES: acyltransferase [Pseudooceanicola]MBT9386738.1 acyltransferase [Pseudooceanicola endophyticus]MXN20779.1 acyltransferase family protein [Pseudooceanicola albus]